MRPTLKSAKPAVQLGHQSCATFTSERAWTGGPKPSRFVARVARAGPYREDAAQPNILKRIASRYLPRAVKKLVRSLFNYLSSPGHRSGVLFIGYAEGALGLGQLFRDHLAAAAEAGIAFSIHPTRVGIETRLLGPFMPERYDTTHAFDINVTAVATDYAPAVFETLDPRRIRRSYNVLYTFWELPEAPEAWRTALSNFDEIWVPNGFVADAFRKIFTGTITIVPPAVHTGEDRDVDRCIFGMDPERFYFLFSFDYSSYPNRKNPIGVVRAFQSAFPDREDNTGLVVKSIGPTECFPEMWTTLHEAAERDRRIVVMDRSLGRDDMLGLIRAADVYVSLHRSEGFGAGMAEAMSLGRAVIGTDFSGNTCFLTRETGFPVPYTLRAVTAEEYPWASGQVWAEPDTAAAAQIMRLVFERRDLAEARALAGKTFITTRHGRQAVGKAIKERLSQIEAQLKGAKRFRSRESEANHCQENRCRGTASHRS